jgi:hypothetical protein
LTKLQLKLYPRCNSPKVTGLGLGLIAMKHLGKAIERFENDKKKSFKNTRRNTQKTAFVIVAAVKTSNLT